MAIGSDDRRTTLQERDEMDTPNRQMHQKSQKAKVPSFTRCMDDDCTQCEEIPASRAALDKRFLLNLKK